MKLCGSWIYLGHSNSPEGGRIESILITHNDDNELERIAPANLWLFFSSFSPTTWQLIWVLFSKSLACGRYISWPPTVMPLTTDWDGTVQYNPRPSMLTDKWSIEYLCRAAWRRQNSLCVRGGDTLHLWLTMSACYLTRYLLLYHISYS